MAQPGRRPRHAERDLADVDRGARLRRGESALRHCRGLGRHAISVPRPHAARHADRLAVRHLAGRRRADVRAVVRAAGIFRPLAPRARRANHLRPARPDSGDDVRHAPLRRPRIDPRDGGDRPRRRNSRPQPGRVGLANLLAGDAAQYQMGPALRRDLVQRAGDGRVRGRLRRLRAHRRPDRHDAPPRAKTVRRIQQPRFLRRRLAVDVTGLVDAVRQGLARTQNAAGNGGRRGPVRSIRVQTVRVHSSKAR